MNPTEADPGLPLWLKVLIAFGIATLILVLLLIAAGHGPGSHH